MKKSTIATKRDKRRRTDRRHELSKDVLTKLPSKVDLRRKVPSRLWPVWDQGRLMPSCTAHAAAGAALYAMIRAKRRPLFQPSRLFLYHCERSLMLHDRQTEPGRVGTVGYAMDILRTRGTCADARARGVPEDVVWKYDATNPMAFKVKPTERCFKFAAKHRMPESKLYLKNDLDHLRGRLAEGHPFTIVVDLYDSYELAGRSGDIPMAPMSPMPSPTASTPPAAPPPPPPVDMWTGSRHAMLVVGYDDSTQRFLVRNSFGTTWGKRGYGTIPYAYVTDPELCDPNSFWTLKLEETPSRTRARKRPRR
jgi:hypothetical protein